MNTKIKHEAFYYGISRELYSFLSVQEITCFASKSFLKVMFDAAFILL